MRFFKKLFKIFGIIFLVLLIAFIILINIFFKPKSDQGIQESFNDSNVKVYIDYKNFEGNRTRIISTRKMMDTTLPNLIFVHGSPGSAMDYEKYLKDDELHERANVFTYDRVGYGEENIGEITDIATEIKLLNSITDSIGASKTVVVGYSYGGPIALGSKRLYKKIVLPAPAVYSEVEPMFWALNFYKWRVTRWLMPELLQAASKEKLQHQEDLREHQEDWGNTLSSVYAIHGNKDWIVPIGNSEFIEKQFKDECFEILILDEAGHDLIWSRFEEIKNELIKALQE